MATKAKAKTLVVPEDEAEIRAELELRLRAEEAGFQESLERDLTLDQYIRQAWHVIEPQTPFIEGWHIDCISEYLTAVTQGQIRRLLINMPPRSGKSNTVTVCWPTWEWSKLPHTRWIFASYSGSLSTKHSLDRRTILNSRWYKERWGNVFALSEDQDQKTEYMNSCRGVMVATSIGGTATGKGGSRIVVDDAHNPLQAESEIEREKAIQFYDRSLSNRLDDKRTGAIVGVMQRLHQRDLSARMIELGFVHLKLPVIARERTVVRFPLSGREVIREEGDLLWPAKDGLKEIEAAEEVMGPYGFAGQMQQEPAPPGGEIFKVDRFQIVDTAPPCVKRIRYWDKAASQKKSADYTAGVLMGRTADRKYVVLDVRRGRYSPGEREELIKQTASLDGRNVPVWVEQEPGSGGLESAQATIKNLAGYLVHAERVTGDKVTRARPLAAQVEGGNVCLVRAEWNTAFLAELEFFPNGTHDDMVDASASCFNKLALAPTVGQVLTGGARPGGVAMTAAVPMLDRASAILGGRSNDAFPELKGLHGRF